MPWSRCPGELLAEVTVHEVAECRDGRLSLRTFGPNEDGRALAHAHGEHPQDALRIARDAVLEDLHLRVLEARGGLHEERRRPGMEADLVRDRQRAFRDAQPALLVS